MGYVAKRNEYTEWLAGIKIDDKVGIQRNYYGNYTYEIGTIIKITPTRQMELASFPVKFKNGAYGNYKIVPLTDEIKAHIKRANLGKRLTNFCYLNLPLNKMEAIWGIINDGNKTL